MFTANIVHWIAYNLSPDRGLLSTNTNDLDVKMGLSYQKKPAYAPPNPPSGETHQYKFTLFAFQKMLPEKNYYTHFQILEAGGPVVEQTSLTGYYKKP